ncbi:MAG TPA: alpha/beta hydrolase [Thermoanaerobaculia bacterium]|nr:alpha/beta hydrolase [Thermoanaerobaculia bacterium]
MASGAARAQAPAPRVVDLTSADSTHLKASYFAAATPGPGVLLFHQSNRTRASWAEVAQQLAAAGIHTLTVDSRGHGESSGKDSRKERWPHDLDAAFQYLVSQPGVAREVIGIGGAGVMGVEDAVETARRHAAQVKSLVLLSGETLSPQLEFLRQAWQLPGLFVADDNDEYPPIVEAMEWLYLRASNSGNKFVHYSAAKDAPWLWYEPFDVGKVPAKGGHGTDMFKVHPELPGIILEWFTTTLVKTSGHAPADALASASILREIATPGGAAKVTQQLIEERRKDPAAQLFPEINVDMIGSDRMRDGEIKEAIEMFRVNLLAYPDSADAHNNLADAYQRDGQSDLARKHAERALVLLDAHTAPASSWSDTEERRGEIRRSVEQVLKALEAKPAASGRPPGSALRD